MACHSPEAPAASIPSVLALALRTWATWPGFLSKSAVAQQAAAPMTYLVLCPQRRVSSLFDISKTMQRPPGTAAFRL